MIKRFTGLLFVATLAGTMSLTARAADKDHDKIQGTWKIDKAQMGGMDMPADMRDNTKIEFKGDKVIVRRSDRDDPAEFKVDSTKSPKTIDVTPKKEGEKTHAGIYKLDGDTLTICINHDETRPTKFESPEGTQTMLLVLKRDKK